MFEDVDEALVKQLTSLNYPQILCEQCLAELGPSATQADAVAWLKSRSSSEQSSVMDKTKEMSGALPALCVQYASQSVAGWKPYNEDAAFLISNVRSFSKLGGFAVLDGHGGMAIVDRTAERLADVLAANILTMDDPPDSSTLSASATATFAALDAELRLHAASGGGAAKSKSLASKKKTLMGQATGQAATAAAPHAWTGGATCAMVLLTPSHVLVANIGDTRCVLWSGGKAQQLSTDHRPDRDTEAKRIKKAGGKVTEKKVDGILSVSRSFGDFELKQGPTEKHHLIATPDIQIHKRSASDGFLIVASDGVWDFLTNDEACKIVADIISTPSAAEADASSSSPSPSSPSSSLSSSSLLPKAARAIVEKSLDRGSKDNVTALVVKFTA